MRVELDMSPSESAHEDDDPTYDWHGLYGVALDQLRDVIVPRIEDGFAVQRTKGLARLIRYLEAVDRHGRTYARAELADLESILGTPVERISWGRRQLSIGVRDGTIAETDALARRRPPGRAGRGVAPGVVGRHGRSALRPADAIRAPADLTHAQPAAPRSMPSAARGRRGAGPEVGRLQP